MNRDNIVTCQQISSCAYSKNTAKLAGWETHSTLMSYMRMLHPPLRELWINIQIWRLYGAIFIIPAMEVYVIDSKTVLWVVISLALIFTRILFIIIKLSWWSGITKICSWEYNTLTSLGRLPHIFGFSSE